MKRLHNILILLFLSSFSFSFAQEETRVIDSLESVVAKQEGREKVLAMMELSNAFFDFSFDDCVHWSEVAIKEAKKLGFTDLEADAIYNLGMFYGDHADNDLAQDYLSKAYLIHSSIGKEKEASYDLWMQAYYEHVIGHIDTAFTIYEKVMKMADGTKDNQLKAKALRNVAIIHYQSMRFNEAEVSLKKSREIFALLNDTSMVMRIDSDLAGVYMEWGNTVKAKELFSEVIPKIEAAGDYGLLITVYKNYGQLFVKEHYKFDSASFYYGKAYSIIEFLESYGIEINANDKVDLLVEIGNALYNIDNYKDAEDWYIKAFELAKSSSNVSGQMLACVGLGLVYSYLSKPAKSLYYLNLIDELKSKSGISIAYSTIKIPIILNYARLGKYKEVGNELNEFKDQFDGLLRENNDLYDQLSVLQDEAQGLLEQYESQNEQIKVLQSQRDQYRMAFFGLLAIAIFALVVLIAYKIVRKNRAKV